MYIYLPRRGSSRQSSLTSNIDKFVDIHVSPASLVLGKAGLEISCSVHSRWGFRRLLTLNEKALPVNSFDNEKHTELFVSFHQFKTFILYENKSGRSAFYTDRGTIPYPYS